MTTEELLHAQLRGQVPCPACGSSVSEVTNSRWSKTANGRLRRRKCTACQSAFSTVEVLYVDQPPVEGRPLTHFPAFIQQIKGQTCPRCNGEGVLRKGRRLAHVLETFRKECGKTRAAVAASMKIPRQYLEKLEKGEKVWPPDTIKEFLVACSK